MNALGIYLLFLGIIVMYVTPIAVVCEMVRKERSWPMFFFGAALGAVGAVIL